MLLRRKWEGTGWDFWYLNEFPPTWDGNCRALMIMISFCNVCREWNQYILENLLPTFSNILNLPSGNRTLSLVIQMIPQTTNRYTQHLIKSDFFIQHLQSEFCEIFSFWNIFSLKNISMTNHPLSAKYYITEYKKMFYIIYSKFNNFWWFISE